MLKNFQHIKNIRSKEGITLIALVVTIIILLILAAVTIALVLGPDGVTEKARQTKAAGRYSNIMDKLYTRDAETEIASRIGETVEGNQEFIQRMISEGSLKIGEGLDEDAYNEDEGMIYLGRQLDGTFLYEVELGEFSSANLPDLTGFNQDTTYYVTWDTTVSPYVINESTKISQSAPDGWSNYSKSKKQWANIKTTGGGNDCYWVWIPRYAYKIPTSNTNIAETIDIKFLYGTSNTAPGESIAITNTTPTPGSWVVHPAFTNAGNNGFGELQGIWVAKYEASSEVVSEIAFEGSTLSGNVESLITNGGGTNTNQQIRVKPNVTSWRGISLRGMFDVCKKMTNVSNLNSSLTGTIGIDSHMMKNTEWGAVAYLRNSKYGKNDRVWKNSFSNSSPNYSPITGLAGSEPNGRTSSTATMYTYNTTGGVNASTTGNVYGVYDMVGGAEEVVAAYLSELSLNSSYNVLINAEDKYKDKYDHAGTGTGSQANYMANTDKYGDAVYETSSSGNSWGSSWYEGWAEFPKYAVGPYPYVLFSRGGDAAGLHESIFSFEYTHFDRSNSKGFRPTLVTGQ